ncbi:MAG: hypothetical protein QXE75_05995 [Sulfolobales archaeon]
MFPKTSYTLGEWVLASPEAYIALVRAHRLLSSVRTLVLHDLGAVVVDKERVTVRRGDEVSLPLWLALELQHHGYAEVRDISLRDVDLLKYLHMERTSKGRKLAELREDLYFSAAMTASKMSAEKTSEALPKAEKFRGVLNSLLDLRLSKLVNAAINLDVKQASEVSKILEEIVLYKLLKKVLELWRDSVLRYVE